MMTLHKQKILTPIVLITFYTTSFGQVHLNDASYKERDIPSGCTVISISKGDSVFFGGNDDYINSDSYFWVEQGDSSRYGVVWIGTPDNPQQGINEKGLAYDSNGLPRFDVNPHPERIPVNGEYHNYCMQIMHECSTVEGVIDWVNEHQRYPYMHDQMHFADATGDAVIISTGKDGEMVFTRKVTGDGFLVSTNFNVAYPSNGYSYPCWRYELANEVMGNLINKEEPVNREDIVSIMDAVHEEGASWTIETMIVDLVNGILYIYYFYQYDRPAVLNIHDELSNPREPGPLSSLFPEDVRQEAARRYNKNNAGLRINKSVGLIWPVTVSLCIFLLFTMSAAYKKSLIFWLPAVIVLGPLALIIRIVTEKRGSSSLYSIPLIETLGNLIPIVISFTMVLTILIIRMLSGSISWQFQVLTMFVLPIIIGLLFHSLFLAPSFNSNYIKFIANRSVQIIITTLLALGGIIPVALPLVNSNLSMSLIIPLSPYTVITCWAFIVLGAFAGGLFIFLYELWAVKRGFHAWAGFNAGDAEVSTPPFHKIWWWLIISALIFIAGLIITFLLIG
jgi:hypothetical protein